MYRRMIVLLIVIIMALITGCQTDKNSVGVNFYPDPVFVESTIIDSALCFSYDNELSIYRGETEMLCAEYENITSICLLNFNDMPSEIDSLSGAVLSLAINENISEFDITSLKIGRIMHTWDETATWEYPDSDSTDVLWDVNSQSVLDRDYSDIQFTQSEDSLAVIIPSNLIETWEVDGLAGYNLAVYVDGGYLTIKSSETSYGPRLKFSYKSNGEVIEYNKECYFDTYITPEKTDKVVYENQIVLQNIKPIRNYLKFDIEEMVLGIDNITEENLDKILINKAELIFTIDKANCSFYDETNDDMKELDVNIRWVNREVPGAELLDSDDLESVLDDIPYPYYILSSSTVKMADSLAVIDVSPIVANNIKGRLDNNGIVLVSEDESGNLGKIALFGFNAPDLQKPRLKLVYTIPGLN
jgi:hypothetical protein